MPPPCPLRPHYQAPACGRGWVGGKTSAQLQWLIVQPVVAGIGPGDYNNKVLTISSGWVSIAWGVFDFQSLWQGRRCINGVCCSYQPSLSKSESHPPPLRLSKGTVPVSSLVPGHVRVGSCSRRPRHSVNESCLHQLRQALTPPPLPPRSKDRHEDLIPATVEALNELDRSFWPSSCFLPPHTPGPYAFIMLFPQSKDGPLSFCPG